MRARLLFLYLIGTVEASASYQRKMSRGFFSELITNKTTDFHLHLSKKPHLYRENRAFFQRGNEMQYDILRLR